MYECTVEVLCRVGHEVHRMERHSAAILGKPAKFRAAIEGIYSFGSKRQVARALSTFRPDIVHAHNLYPSFSPSVFAACKRFGVPVVMSCHNLRLICPIGVCYAHGTVCERCAKWSECLCVLRNCRGDWAESLAYAVRAATARILHLVRDTVDLLLVPSRFLKQKLVDAGWCPERIVVLPNTVLAQNRRPSSGSGSYAAFVGRLSPEKGVDLLLRAAASLPSVPIRLAGVGPLARARGEDLPPNIKFVGWLDGERLADFYANARFVVVPSECFETFGLAAAEAMSYGVPVIASRIGALPEVVDDNVCGFLCEPGNVKDLAHKIDMLWRNPSLCSQMGQAGRQKVIGQYSGEAYLNSLIAAYEKAICIVSSN